MEPERVHLFDFVGKEEGEPRGNLAKRGVRTLQTGKRPHQTEVKSIVELVWK